MTQLHPPLPEAFVHRMRPQLGPDADAFLSALDAPPHRGLRLNPRKPLAPADLPSGLLASIPWEPHGYWLSPENTMGSHPLHEAGAYYLQEPSAMIPARVLAPKPGQRVLDLCAAPGGKALQLADQLEGQGLLVVNEPVPSRAQVLSRNIERMGIANALVVSADPRMLAAAWPQVFDAVLVDAPCSGEGMFRRHPEARLEWDPTSPSGCAARQRHILDSAYSMLAPGGRLAYSTCTFSPQENEDVIRWFLRQYPDMKSLDFTVQACPGRSLVSREGMLPIYPHQLQGEGHFVALLQKPGTPFQVPFLPPEKALRPPAKALLDAYSAFIQCMDATGLPRANAALGDMLLAAPPLPPLAGIKVLRAGLHLGALKGKVFAPDHALALGLPLPYGVPTVSLSARDAAAYQSGETLSLPDIAPGYALLTYCGLALGFAKASDGQLKNHYPKGLRRPFTKEILWNT